MQSLVDKVAVVTGAGSGIGRGLAVRFAEEGCRVVLADIEAEPLAESAALVRDAGAEALEVVTDVTDLASVTALAEATIERFGTAHILCNNAGVGGGGRIAESQLVDWQWVIGVNLWGVVHGIAVFLPILEANGDEGHIVNTASIAGLMAGPGIGPYNASKFAVVGISETLFHELADAGSAIGVSVLCPGYVRTNIATSQRNRPEHLRRERKASTGARRTNDEIAGGVSSGLEPHQVADLVVHGMRAGHFWIVTDRDLLRQVAERNQALAEGRNPPRNTP